MGRAKCQTDNCNSFATYGHPSGPNMYCFKHKMDNMVNKTSLKCNEELCQKYGSFALPNQKSKKFCSKHKLPEMVDIVTKKCKCCSIISSYGYPNGLREYCADHKLDGMINKCSIICKYDGCKFIAFFGSVNGEKEYCTKHKLEGMVNNGYNKCINEECHKFASYGFKEIGKLQYCFEHKPDGTKSFKKCIEPNCEYIPYYGYPSKKKEYCQFHKKDGMIYRSSIPCKHLGCPVRAAYGFTPNDKQYCFDHKLDGMLNNRNTRCNEPGCETVPSFGSNKRREYCVEHKKPNMVYTVVRKRKRDDEIYQSIKKPRIESNTIPKKLSSLDKYADVLNELVIDLF